MDYYNDNNYINNKKTNHKKYFRKRKINKRCKKYPTKPKTDKQIDTKYERFMKYNTINHYGNIVDNNIEYVNWKDNIEYVNWKDNIVYDNNDKFDDGILGALICEKDNILKITFLDSITKKYVIEDYEIPDTGIEPYVWIPPIEYISPEINYEIIWKFLDLQFYKYERPYVYKSKLEGGPSIQFYDIDISKL